MKQENDFKMQMQIKYKDFIDMADLCDSLSAFSHFINRQLRTHTICRLCVYKVKEGSIIIDFLNNPVVLEILERVFCELLKLGVKKIIEKFFAKETIYTDVRDIKNFLHLIHKHKDIEIEILRSNNNDSAQEKILLHLNAYNIESLYEECSCLLKERKNKSNN